MCITRAWWQPSENAQTQGGTQGPTHAGAHPTAALPAAAPSLPTPHTPQGLRPATDRRGPRWMPTAIGWVALETTTIRTPSTAVLTSLFRGAAQPLRFLLKKTNPRPQTSSNGTWVLLTACLEWSGSPHYSSPHHPH